MNSKMLSIKINSFKKILDFSFDSSYKEQNVLSKQYFFNVLFKKYMKDITTNGCVVFADFDKLNHINKTYGFEKGSEIMFESIKVIRSIFPASTKISRIAGDEFAFIMEDYNLKDANNYIKLINPTLANKRNEIFGGIAPNNFQISITCAGSEFGQTNNFYAAYKSAEEYVSLMKATSHNASISGISNSIPQLVSSITSGLQDFFDSLRFDPTHNTQKDSEPIFANILDSIFQSTMVTTDTIDASLQDSPLFCKIQNNPISLEDVKIIDNLLQSSKYDMMSNSRNLVLTEDSIHELGNIQYSSISQLLDILIRHPITNELSKEAFKKYISENLSYPINIVLFSSTLLKPSNTLKGHVQTDIDIHQISTLLHNHLASYYKFNDSPYFSFINLSPILSNFLISLNASDTLLVCPANTPISLELTEAITNNINCSNRILKLVYGEPTVINSHEELMNYINSFSQLASIKDKKDKFKLEFIHSSDCIELLKLHLDKSFQIYCNNLGDQCNSPENLNKLKELILYSFKALVNKKDKIYKNINKKDSEEIIK